MEKMLIFPLKYVFDVDKTVSFATREVSFEGQNKQIQQLSTNPMKSWNITVRGTPEERNILESFFEKVGGNTRPFVFMDERNRPRWCRFADSKLNITEKRAWTNEFNPQGDVVGFEAKIVIELAQSEADENADTAEAEALWAKRFKGEDGAIFLPHISPSGLLTWTNDKGLPNPEPRQTIAIKGDQGVTFRPSVDPKTANLSWTNDGGLQNPATVNVRGFTFTPSVSNDGTISWSNDGSLTNPGSVNVRGATFTPSISDDGTISWTNDKEKENPKPINVRGATFTPSVDGDGNLSWTNDKNKSNPKTVNIKGPKGEKGDPGERGLQGIQGPPGTTDYRQLTNRPSLVSLERNTAYEVGDIVYSKKLPAGWYLECVTAGTTGSTEPDLKSAVSTGGGVLSDGSCRFSVKQDKTTLMHNPLIKDLNYTVNNPSTFSVGYTSAPTLNNRDYYYNHVITMMAYNEISQLALPMNQTKRIAYRGSGDLNSTTPITRSWREIPYVDETPLLQDNGNNTKKIVVDRLEGVADSSVSQDYIQDLGSYVNRTVGELKQAILDAIRTFNLKACIYIRAEGHIIKACQNWGNDSYVIEPGAALNTICIRNIYSRGSLAFVEIFSYGYDKYVTYISNGNWMPMKKVNLIDA